MILGILIFLILICVVKISSNLDLVKNNSKTSEDKANYRNAVKFYNTSNYALGILVLAIIIIIVLVICQFTELDTVVINYFKVDFYTEDFFKSIYYYIPAFMLVIRQIIVEVKISEFLYKYFKVTEEEVDTKDLVRNILYKKKPVAQDEVKVEVKDKVETLEEGNDLPKEKGN